MARRLASRYLAVQTNNEWQRLRALTSHVSGPAISYLRDRWCLALLLFLVLGIPITWWAYEQLGMEGIIIVGLSSALIILLLTLLEFTSRSGSQLHRKISYFWILFLFFGALFLLLFPFSTFLRAVGLAPGLVLTGVLALLCEGLRSRRSLANLGALIVLGLAIWLWGEAGREGFVVMPADLPEKA